MKRRLAILSSVVVAFLSAPERAGAEAADAAKLFAEHCASCHGPDRLGGLGPALIPQSLVRLRRENATTAITKGLPATQMAGFEQKLPPEAIKSLVDYIYTPLAKTPHWGLKEIEATLVGNGIGRKLERPTFAADPLNLFVVVETGDHHVSILDGDKLEPIHRFQSRFALHGGPKFSPDGRFVYFASRDGWVSKFDLWDMKIVAEVRAGLNTRNIALSKDGKLVAVANYLPHTLVILSAETLKVTQVVDVKNSQGTSSRVSAVYQAPHRNSFIAALKDVPEIWEIATGGSDPLALRRIGLDEPLDDFFFDQRYRHLIGSSRDGANAMVVDLDAGRPIAKIAIAGMPHLGAGITWSWQGRSILATPHLKSSGISIIDMTSWTLVKRIEAAGPGFFMRSHASSRYAFTDAMLGANKDTLHVIDKQKLEVVAGLRPAPGKTIAHIEFDRHGRYVLASLWEMDGAIIVYDAATLSEVKRIPMRKPSGKYNVYNKITFEEGTSH